MNRKQYDEDDPDRQQKEHLDQVNERPHKDYLPISACCNAPATVIGGRGLSHDAYGCSKCGNTCRLL